jgi:large subunit ribosomal protein L29
MLVKTKELREKSEADLLEELVALRKQLFEARMSFHARKLENTASMLNLRKSIARILTVIKEKKEQEI